MLYGASRLSIQLGSRKDTWAKADRLGDGMDDSLGQRASFPTTVTLVREGLPKAMIDVDTCLRLYSFCHAHAETDQQWILYHSGWYYPPGSIWGRIYLVPLEEHLFFLVQSTMLVLLHSIISHPALLPSGIRRYIRNLPPARPDPSERKREGEIGGRGQQPVMVQTLERRPLAASFWLASTLLGALLVHEAHDLRIVPVSLGLGKAVFYLGWILIWISPVLAFLTYLGGWMGREEKLALAVGTAWLWGVDTYVVSLLYERLDPPV